MNQKAYKALEYYKIINMALTKYFDLFSAVRTFHIAVILDDSKYRYLHHLSHIKGFLQDVRHNLWDILPG